MTNSALGSSPNGSPARRRPVRLGSGNALPLDKLPRRPGAAPRRVIVMAGPTESGKTTILTTIYDAFHRGPFANFFFAGSRTLVALEERCHEGRLASALDVPTTARTLSSEAGDLLHFALGADGASVRDLYVNDVTGERFDRIVQRPASAREMEVLAEADGLAVVLDGALLVDRERRDVTVYQAETLARAIAENGGIKAGTPIDVVVSKFDLLGDDTRLRGHAERVSQKVLAAVPQGHRGIALMTSARSARPEVIESGLGLDSLLDRWVGQRPEPSIALRATRRT